MGLTERATRLIASKGRAVTLKREALGEPDGFGGYLPGEVTSYPATAATARYEQELALIAGGLVEAGDLRLIVSVDGLAIEPEPGDRVEAEGEEYRVLNVAAVGTAGTAHFFDLQVRRDL